MTHQYHEAYQTLIDLNKNELRKVFDTRLKWYGIDQIEKEIKGMYAKECACEFEFGTDQKFICSCGWKDNFTEDEYKSFQGKLFKNHLFALSNKNRS